MPPKAKQMSRRDMLGAAKVGAVGLAVLGGGGYFFFSRVQAGIAEGDLSRLGNGMPTIVQIHDPQCSSCRTLQRQTRMALDEFEDDQLQYLVANLDHPDGRQFAAGYGVGRVTLLLFDGRGGMRRTITGAHTKEALVEVFQGHLDATKGR